MKFYLLILSLALYQIVSAQTPGGWSLVPEDEVDSSPAIQHALTFGVSHVIEEGVHKGDLPNADYDITEIFLVLRQVVNGLNYRFEVLIESEKGDIFRVKCDVYSPPAGELSLTQYKYGSPDDESWGSDNTGEFEFLPEEVYFAEENEWGMGEEQDNGEWLLGDDALLMML